MDRLATGSPGACPPPPPEKQQLESIKIWPGQPISKPLPSLHGLAQPSWYWLPWGFTLWKRASVLPPSQGQIALLHTSPRSTFAWGNQNVHFVAAECASPPQFWGGSSAAVSASPSNEFIAPSTGQMLWHLWRGQRACHSYYASPLGKQFEEKYLAIWKEARFQNGLLLCDSLPCTDEREGL